MLEKCWKRTAYYFFSREMTDRIHFPNLGVLSALAWSEPSAAWAKARSRLPLFSLTTICIALFSTARVETHCKLRMSNGSCWQQIYFHTSSPLSRIFNVSCETDEILCMRKRKLTVSHTASKLEFNPGGGGGLWWPLHWLPPAENVLLTGQWCGLNMPRTAPYDRRIPVMPRGVAVFLRVSTELSRGRERERALASV